MRSVTVCVKRCMNFVSPFSIGWSYDKKKKNWSNCKCNLRQTNDWRANLWFHATLYSGSGRSSKGCRAREVGSPCGWRDGYYSVYCFWYDSSGSKINMAHAFVLFFLDWSVWPWSRWSCKVVKYCRRDSGELLVHGACYCN